MIEYAVILMISHEFCIVFNKFPHTTATPLLAIKQDLLLLVEIKCA